MSIISVALCAVIIQNTVALAIEPQPDATVESISIINRYGVLLGETYQMTATVNSDGSLFNAVEWSSSNPDAISCTEDGKIKGLIAGEKATITCKAKWGKAKDSVDVYCAERVNSKKCYLKSIFTFVYARPSSGIIGGTIMALPKILQTIMFVFQLIAMAPSSSDALIISPTLTVYGRIGNYAYVRYGETELFDGFVKYSVLGTEIDGFLDLSSKNLDVWANDIAYSHRKLTTDYKGSVKWSDSDKDNKYIDFDDTTGQIIGKSGSAGNKVTITATADGMSKSCTIHLLYKWPQQWTGKTNRKTTLLLSDGTGYKNSSVTLEKGQSFTVHGDCGTNDGKAYGVAKVGGQDRWGYVPISCLSTKGTISQYNNLGWTWPVKTKEGKPKPNYISSPYGWRDSNPKRHQGIDVTTGTQGEIDGYEVVPAFSGTVVFCGDEYGYDWGYCVAIRSNETDLVSGLPYIAVYMHLKNAPKVSENQKVVAGKTVLGYVGNTTSPGVNMGYHLHFEINNQNSSIGLKGDSQIVGYGRKSYDYLINPIFLYIDEYENDEIRYNETSEAEEKYMKTFWYGNGDTLAEAS